MVADAVLRMVVGKRAVVTKHRDHKTSQNKLDAKIVDKIPMNPTPTSNHLLAELFIHRFYLRGTFFPQEVRFFLVSLRRR